MSYTEWPVSMLRSFRTAAIAATCLAISACAWDFIPDPPDIPDLDGLVLPDGSDFDIPDAGGETDEGEVVCKRNCYDRVCGPDDCGGTCGQCPPGTVCSLDYSICLAESVLLPDGSPCGRNSVCVPELEDPFNPGEYYSNSDWPRCMDHQCAGLKCERGVCSRPCVVRNDSVVNGTGINGADGIEDNTADSDCPLATGGLFQGATMCVARKRNSSGQLEGVCVPGSSFTPCNPMDNCPGEEGCSYVRTTNGMERRCVAPLESDVLFTEPCGWDDTTGLSYVCRSGLCMEKGCTRPCDVDADCLTEGAECDRGLCAGTGFACLNDADCSPWKCGSSVVIDETMTRACEPRSCVGDLDCRGGASYCEPGFGWDDMGQIVSSGWCARADEDGAPVGTPCGDPDGGPLVVCRNAGLCIDGFCSARCDDDFDCYVHGDFRCALSQILYSEGYISVDQWLDTGFCVPSGYRREGCTSDESCGERACTPFVSEARGTREVVTTCMDPPEDGWPIGTPCGELAWDAVCRSRFCFGEDIPNGVPGWCSQVCASDLDCPGSTFMQSAEWRWVCAGLPVIGADSPRADDDLFASWCVPVPVASTLDDCGSTRICAAPDQVCSPILRAGPGVVDERVDYRCVAAGSGAVPGSICDPFGDGTDCVTGICSPSAMTDIGFCSHVCLSDDQCAQFGEGVTCQPSHRGNSTDGEPLTADVCRMTGECIICQDDTDCSEGARCVNIGFNYWYEDMRCVRECVDDSDCADITGMACEDISPVFSASSIKLRACMTPSCS